MYYLKNNTSSQDHNIVVYLNDIGKDDIIKEIYKGLYAKQKFLSPKFFYDKKGTELFEMITQLEEYYPNRTEKSILLNIVEKLNFKFENSTIIELGSGDSSKISMLFKQIPKELLSSINYFATDISISAIEKSIANLSQEFPLKNIKGIAIDFFYQLNKIPQKENRLFCFFGSTIGNFKFLELAKFMLVLGNEMNKGDSLLLGLDMMKEISIIEKAYNDKKGVTAEFNKNILNVVNKLIKSDFNTHDFFHYAFFNKQKSRIEMHLKALKDLEINSELK
ncbi:MAG: L-histidine N(alpha)-methyltransferase, partial [Bacteroidetes bacterium]|nr:L-histidine N(alpha)-methyltransferase [Bacteroidota bacterium]